MVPKTWGLGNSEYQTELSVGERADRSQEAQGIQDLSHRETSHVNHADTGEVSHLLDHNQTTSVLPATHKLSTAAAQDPHAEY